MATTSNQRGGAGRNQGRKPISTSEPSVTLSLRLTPSQREKLDHLGGAAWVRSMIDKAKPPQ